MDKGIRAKLALQDAARFCSRHPSELKVTVIKCTNNSSYDSYVGMRLVGTSNGWGAESGVFKNSAPEP
jgi:hypothetical protein